MKDFDCEGLLMHGFAPIYLLSRQSDFDTYQLSCHFIGYNTPLLKDNDYEQLTGLLHRLGKVENWKESGVPWTFEEIIKGLEEHCQQWGLYSNIEKYNEMYSEFITSIHIAFGIKLHDDGRFDTITDAMEQWWINFRSYNLEHISFKGEHYENLAALHYSFLTS